MKNCPNCNHQNPDEAKFCETCGTALAGNIPQSFLANQTNTTTSEGTKIGLAILSFIIPIVGIVLGISQMNDKDPSKKAAGKTYLYLGIGGLVLACLYASVVGSSGY
ncbi:zinc-ribbon domain-containing protein [Segetibacter aerophilus]|uniref:Zinc-ribbon domain-containing protein n=1 Tax=Segetibacter aerophilus TaxID=670293 RepID=A0A512BHU3_9BACT|nr:zinc ribbon domain-containing protein [Segetibacter aerophilus]GEO11445.1 hypothetical protein SAE01_39410 [Segetibacter aerophilus]